MSNMQDGTREILVEEVNPNTTESKEELSSGEEEGLMITDISSVDSRPKSIQSSLT